MKEKINLFVIIEYSLCAIIILSTLLLKPSITSMAFLVTFVVLLIEFMLIIRNNPPTLYIRQVFLILVVSSISLLLSSILFSRSLSFDYFKEFFMFCSTIIIVFAFVCIPVNGITVRFILMANVIISFLYPIAYNYFPHEKLIVGEMLYLNFDNPNLAGMWILQSLLYIVLSIFLIKNKIWKIISICALIPNVSYLYKTESRNAWVAAFTFVVMLIFILFKNGKPFSIPYIRLVNIFPILFVPLYLRLIHPIMEKGYFDFLISEGKSLESRIVIWEYYLGKLKGFWTIGSYATMRGNVHNAYLVVLCSYGIITLCLVIQYFTRISLDINSQFNKKRNQMCLAAFLASLIMGIGEGALFSGGQGIYILCCGFILMARYDWDNDKVIENYEQ